MSTFIPTRQRYRRRGFSRIARACGVEYKSHWWLNSTHASAPRSAPTSASIGSMGSASPPTPRGAGSQTTIGFAPTANALRAVA